MASCGGWGFPVAHLTKSLCESLLSSHADQKGSDATNNLLADLVSVCVFHTPPCFTARHCCPVQLGPLNEGSGMQHCNNSPRTHAMRQCWECSVVCIARTLLLECLLVANLLEQWRQQCRVCRLLLTGAVVAAVRRVRSGPHLGCADCSCCWCGLWCH
jgi:hypothetical protein